MPKYLVELTNLVEERTTLEVEAPTEEEAEEIALDRAHEEELEWRSHGNWEGASGGIIVATIEEVS